MNQKLASLLALALLIGFYTGVANAQVLNAARPPEVNAAALSMPNPPQAKPAIAPRGTSVIRPDAASFTEEQLRQITRLAPETSAQSTQQTGLLAPALGSGGNGGTFGAAGATGTAPPRPAQQAVNTLPATVPTALPGATTQPVQTVVVRSAQPRFEITADDETLYLTLRRWTAEAGYQLVWSAGKDFPVKRTLYEADDLSSAIALAMKDTEFSAYPLHACAYTNNVIRVLHVSQSCIPK